MLPAVEMLALINLICRCVKVDGIEVNEMLEAPPEPTVTVAIDS
jgi:hypothetical protein